LGHLLRALSFQDFGKGEVALITVKLDLPWLAPPTSQNRDIGRAAAIERLFHHSNPKGKLSIAGLTSNSKLSSLATSPDPGGTIILPFNKYPGRVGALTGTVRV
jgi:hypothetical protein